MNNFFVGRFAMCMMLLPVVMLGACASQPGTGRDTRAWMDLQKGGSAASAEPQPMTGEVADKVYQRYVDSFGYPLPEQFKRESIKSGEGGGGG